VSRNISTQGSWSNREEEWYVTNKLLLFATQSEIASSTWVNKLNELLQNFNKFETPRQIGEYFPDQILENYGSLPDPESRNSYSIAIHSIRQQDYNSAALPRLEELNEEEEYSRPVTLHHPDASDSEEEEAKSPPMMSQNDTVLTIANKLTPHIHEAR